MLKLPCDQSVAVDSFRRWSSKWKWRTTKNIISQLSSREQIMWRNNLQHLSLVGCVIASFYTWPFIVNWILNPKNFLLKNSLHLLYVTFVVRSCLLVNTKNVVKLLYYFDFDYVNFTTMINHFILLKIKTY